MIKQIQDRFLNEMQQKETELNELKFDYIQFLMSFIPDKDLASIYESYWTVFPPISQMSKEQLLDRHILDRIIGIFERWINNNYNIVLDYTIH